MNEDAIKDAYDLFVNTGYNKSYDNFKALIQSNPAARKDAYDLFVSTGYKKTQKDFDELMGVGAPAPVKKKEQVSPSQQNAQPTSLATGGEMAGGPSAPSARKRYNVSAAESDLQKRVTAKQAAIKPEALTPEEAMAMAPMMGEVAETSTVVEPRKDEGFFGGVGRILAGGATEEEAKAAVIPGPKYELEYKGEKVDTDITNKLVASTFRALGELASTPSFAYDLTKAFMDPVQKATIMAALEPTMAKFKEGNLPAKMLKEKSKEMESKMQKVEGDVTDRFTRGDYADGFKLLSNELASSTPQMLAVMMSGGGPAGMTLLGLNSAQTRAADLEGEDITERQKYTNALAYGGAEVMFELVGMGSIARVTKNIIKREGPVVGKQIVEKGILDMVDDLTMKYPMVFGSSAEGLSEVATTIAQNAADKYGGIDPERDIMSGTADAFIAGNAMGMGLGGVVKLAQTVLPQDKRAQVAKNQEDIIRAKEIAADPNLPEEKRTALEQLINKKIQENEKLQRKAFEKLSVIPEESRSLYASLRQDAMDLEVEIDGEANPIIREALELELESRKKQIKKIEDDAIQKQTAGQVPVQPETRVGQEVVEGKPQPEPQVAAEEGQAQEEVIPGEKAVVSGIEITYPTEQEKTERQKVRNSKEYVSAKAFELPVITEEEFQGDIEGEFAMVTAENPKAQPLTEEENVALNTKAEQWLIDKGYSPKKIVGKYGQAENSFFVKGMTKEDAFEFAKEFNQESVAHSDGMIYQNGKMNPRNKAKDNFETKNFVPGDNVVSIINTPEGPKTFSVGYDFEIDTDFAPKTNIDEAVNKSAESLNMVAPDLKIIVAENTDDAQMQIAEALSAVAPSQAGEVAGGFTTETRGQTVFVNGKPFAMVFNKESADSTTVGHEAWEILLNDAFADDQARMKEFVDSIDAQLRAQGFEDIADKLDAFASQRGYEAVKYSEYMAELGGMLVASGFGKGPLTAQQKTLLQKIGDIINKFAQLFTGKKQFLDQATPEDILGFMITISEKVSKGEDVASFLRPKETKASGVEAKSQKQAIEILDGPKFESKLKEDVASYLNSLRDSEIPPNSTREELMERFINNVYEEVGYYLYSKPDARSAGLTWYIEDMVEFANKVKVVLPELSDENQYKLFLTVLAFTSSGTNPNQNLLYAYNLWNNSKNPSNFEFSKTWGDSKLSFIDKKGKSIASGVIAKETAKEYTVELIDSLGRPVVDKKGNKKYEKIAKSSMKEGYPKPTGYTNRGEIIIGQLEKLEKIYNDLGSIDKVVKWLETPHPIAELRKYNQSVPDVNGKGPGKTNKEYDPNKNAEGERNGAFVFGEKIGSFYQNMIGIGETITMDLWWSRTWNRYMGTMINTVSGKKEIQEVPRSDRERNIMREAVKLVAEDLNLQVSELQAAIWYFEQELWTKSGNESPSYSYVTAIDDLTKKLKVDEETRTKLRAAEADLSEAEKRRQNAAERAAAVVASKGGEIPGAKVTAKSQKSVPAVVDEVLTDDGKGNYVFVHYSDEKRDTIKPMSGSKKNFTGREEVAAISSVGGVAMYYTKQGQVESGVGDVPHTVLVPKDKVYFYGTTERGKVLNDPENFEPEARRRFQEYKNRGNETRPTTYAFDSNNAAAWVTKVAAENGYDMVVTNWGGPKSYRAQTVKELTPEADYTGFKEIPEDVFEIGDEVFVYKRYGKITDIEGDVLTIDTENAFGNFDRSKFQLTKFTRDRILLIEKAKPSVTTRSQKVDVTVIPGYERMMGEVEGILEKSMNRGGSYNQASAAAIGYIQKSAVYERADDSQREQIIRDFKKIRGEKMKAAPSVARIMGEIKDTKEVTVKEKTALKDQIKLEAKAAKDAVAYVKQLRTQISTALRAMTGRGVISARQATTILARYDKMNILNPVMRDRFVDYMSNVLQTAEYLDKIKEASKLRKSIKKASKSADNQAEVSKMANDFAGIDPSRVEDIDQYIENATQVLNSAARKTGDPLMRSLVNMANMANYIEQEMEIQNEQIKNEILSKYQELVDAGVLSSDMTINEIKRVVAAIEDNDSDAQAKVAKAKEALKEMMEEISPVIMQMVRTGEDPFTGEPIEITYEEKKALKSLTEMDLDNLSLADAVKVVEYANNFVANGITSGIVGMTELYNGSLEPGKLVKKGFKSIPIRKYFMKGAGKVWAEGFATLPMLNKLYWGDTRRAIEVSEASGVTGISNGKAKAIKIVDKSVKEYIAKFAKTKDFLASENVLERGMLAFMSRGVVGDEFQVQDEYNRRKTLIEETIQALKDPENSTDLEIAKGEVAQKVYDKILKGSKNAEEVRSKASKTNVDAVDWWINEWSKHYDQMDDVSKNVYNTELSRDSNYTPDRFQLKEAPTATEEDFESSFFGNFEYVDTSKSGSLRKNNRITNLPEDKNGVKKRIVNLDFDVNNVNALTSALIDVETAGSVMKAKGFVTSKDFSKLFSSKEDRDLYKKRIVKYVSRVKGGSYVDQNELAKMNKVINAIASFGVAKALFSLSQPLKQFVPPMLNTLAQTGRFDIAELFKGGMEFIDNSGYPIANRGVGSQGELKSINRKLVEAEKNLALRGLDGVADFSNAALELTLKNPDIYAARASWISFYMYELKKQGIKPSSINWSTHKLNKQAADYAQSMVDSQQNISDTDMQGEIFASKQPATVFLRRALLPLMTFTLNQKTRIWADIRTIGNEVSSKEDKLEAKKSLAGALVELTAFSAISFGVKELLYMTAQAIFGVKEDDEEEEKKKRKMRQSASTAQNFLRDFFLPPIPGMDAVASGGVNMLLEESGLSETIPQKWFNIEDEEARFNLYDKQNQGYLDMLGTQGIAAEKALELAGYYDMAIDGKFTKEYNGNKVEKQVLEEDRKAAALNALVMSGYYGGLLPSDIAYIVGIINKKIQKRAETAEEED